MVHDRTAAVVVCADVTFEPISLTCLTSRVRQVSGTTPGAIACFSGDVRDFDSGRQVLHLEYEAHPDAAMVLTRIANQLVSEQSGIVAVGVQHRIGMLHLGDAALVVVVASVHRAEGFKFCAELVNAVKAELPVWKKQTFCDGTVEWVGCCQPSKYPGS